MPSSWTHHKLTGLWGELSMRAWIPVGNNIFSLLFSLSPLCSFSWTCFWLSFNCSSGTLVCKTITCTLVIPICPRSASCSPINIMPYKATHSRNPMDRTKFLVTPPDGSARRRTIHSTAVSSLWGWPGKSVLFLVQSGHTHTHTPPPVLPGAVWVWYWEMLACTISPVPSDLNLVGWVVVSLYFSTWRFYSP